MYIYMTQEKKYNVAIILLVIAIVFVWITPFINDDGAVAERAHMEDTTQAIQDQ